MNINLTLTTLAAAALIGLAGCASKPMTTEQVAEAQTAKQVSDELSATKNVTKSADGEMVCKRQTVVGSNFKRKICATAAQWEAEEEASRSTVDNIQRRGATVGRGN